MPGGLLPLLLVLLRRYVLVQRLLWSAHGTGGTRESSCTALADHHGLVHRRIFYYLMGMHPTRGAPGRCKALRAAGALGSACIFLLLLPTRLASSGHYTKFYALFHGTSRPGNLPRPRAGGMGCTHVRISGSRLYFLLTIIICIVKLATAEGQAAREFDGVLSLVEFGVFLTPGRTISTADSSHVMQTFLLDVPKSDPDELDISLSSLCERRRRSTHQGLFDVCLALRRHIIWSTDLIQALRDDRDRQWNSLMNLVPVEEQVGRHRRAAGTPHARTFGPDGIVLPTFPSKLKGDDVILTGEDAWTGLEGLRFLSEIDFYVTGQARAKDVKRLRKDFMVLLHSHNDLRTSSATLSESYRYAIQELGAGHDAVVADTRFLGVRLDNLTEIVENVTRDHENYVADLALLNALDQILERRVLVAVLHYMEQIHKLQLMIVECRLMLRHKASQVLIEPSDIQNAVLQTDRYLRKHLPRFKVAFRHPAYYYENSFVLCWREGHLIMVAMTVPITTQQHLFSIFKVTTLPVPIQVYQDEAVDAMRVTDLPTEVAISRDGRYFINQPVLQWSTCFGSSPAVCPDIPYQERTSGDSCMAAIIMQRREAIRERCHIQYIVAARFLSQAISLGGSDILVTGNDTTGQLLCGNKRPEDVPINKYAVVTLGCGCAFRSEAAWIPYRIGDCARRLQTSTVRFVRNELLTAPLLADAWQPASLAGFSIDVLPRSPIPDSLRASMLLKSRVIGEPLVADVRHIEQHILNNRVEWSDLATPEETDWSFGFLADIFSFKEWFPSIAMLLLAAGAVLILIVCCIRKHRHRIPALMMGPAAAVLPKARAADKWQAQFTLAPVTFHPAPTAQEGCASAIVGLLVVITVLVALACILCRRRVRRLQARFPDGLYIEVATPNMKETIHLGHSATPLDQVYLGLSPEPIMKDVVVSGIACWGLCRSQVITPTWGKTLYKAAPRAGARDVPMSLPETLNVSRALAQELRSPTDRRRASVRILRYSAGLATVVPIGLPRMTLDGWRPIGQVVDEDLLDPPTHDGQPVRGRRCTDVSRLRRGPHANQPESTYLTLPSDDAAAETGPDLEPPPYHRRGPLPQRPPEDTDATPDHGCHGESVAARA